MFASTRSNTPVPTLAPRALAIYSHLRRCDLREFRPPEGRPGMLICNPPYGERIGDERELRPLYRLLGEAFADRCRGWTCCVFTSNDAPWREIRLKPVLTTPFWNGKIACRLLRYNIP